MTCIRSGREMPRDCAAWESELRVVVRKLGPLGPLDEFGGFFWACKVTKISERQQAVEKCVCSLS